MKRLLLLSALLAALAGPAAAHRGHAGLTVIQVDPASGEVAVTHRFYAHDVEPALVTIAPDAQPSLDDPKAVAALEAHLASRFRLRLDGVDVTPARTDTHLAGDDVRISFAGETDDREVHQVTVDMDFFPGVHDDQEMQVNVRVAGVTHTVIFRPGTTARTLEF